MKKVFILFAAALFFAACSNEGAFTEQEKKTQDSADGARHVDEFEALEKKDSTEEAAKNSEKKEDQKDPNTSNSNKDSK